MQKRIRKDRFVLPDTTSRIASTKEIAQGLEQRDRGFWWPSNVKQSGLRYWDHAFDMELAVSLAPKHRTVVQAGGHVGMWPLWLSSHFKTVYTFEPHRDNFRCLVRNIQAPNVYPFRAVLSNFIEPVDLREAGSSGGHNIRVDERGESAVDGSLPSIRIDDWHLTDLDFVMLDIEGFELSALRGMDFTLQRCKPIIQVEERGHGVKKGIGDTLEDLEQFLSSLGYVHYATVRNDRVYYHLDNVNNSILQEINAE